jgi:hypothetical protein
MDRFYFKARNKITQIKIVIKLHTFMCSVRCLFSYSQAALNVNRQGTLDR